MADLECRSRGMTLDLDGLGAHGGGASRLANTTARSTRWRQSSKKLKGYWSEDGQWDVGAEGGDGITVLVSSVCWGGMVSWVVSSTVF